ncbi:MAG: hypothetical protein HY290_04125, partial [Planctomycetia bacterium]|nr:hypothetical protein [Planctomycetia bacterium]
VGPQSDVYALGAMLYCLVTGRPPFQAASPTDTLLQVLKQEPVAPRQLNPQVPLDLETIALKCLEKEPARRYATAADLAQELSRFLRGEPIQARPVSTVERTWRWCKRNRLIAGLAAGVLFALLAGTVVSATFGMLANKRAREAADNATVAAEQRDLAHAMSLDAERGRALADEQRQLAMQQEQLARDNARAAELARDEMQAARQAEVEQRAAAERARDRVEAALYFNRISLAQQYWLADNLVGSRRILDDCPPELRAWEWRYLDRMHHADLVTLPGNGQFTTSLKFSADGKRLAAFAQSGDAGVRIWDLATNKPLAEITQARNQKPFCCGDLSADGKTVVLGDRAGTISFWDAETGQLTREFTKLPRSVGSLSLSPNGKWLAAARADGRNGERLIPLTEPPRNEDLVVWDVDSGEEVFHPQGHGFIALFSPDSSRLVSFRMNTALRVTPSTPESFLALFDTADWKAVADGTLGTVSSFAFSGDGKRLAIGGIDRQRNARFLHVLESATGKEVLALTPSRTAGDVDLNHDGSLMAVAGPLGSATIDIWDVKKSRIMGTLRGHSQSINGIAFARDGRLASCSWDNTIRIWDPVAGQQVRRTADAGAGPGMPVAFAPDGDTMAFGRKGMVNMLTGPVKTVTLADAITGRVRRTLTGHDGGPNCLSFSSSGECLISGGVRGDVKIWDCANGKSICTIRAGNGEIVAVALSPDGKTAVSAHEPPEVTRARLGEGQFQHIPVAIKIWDADSGNERAALNGHPGGVYRLVFSHDGKRLVSAGAGGVRFWDVAEGTELPGYEQSVLQSATSSVLQFSPRGDLLVTSGFNSIYLCEYSTGRPVATIQGHRSDHVSAAAISPDQSRIATAAVAEVKLWDVKSGLEILTLPLTDIPSEDKPLVRALSWTKDGQQLRAALSTGVVLTWNGSAAR